MAEIDRRILARALAEIDELRGLKGWAPRLSVNVSARRLCDPGLVEEIAALSPAPGSLGFELVESIFIEQADEGVLKTADALKRLGVDIELDDFGSGHASIVGLLKLRPTRLKIDRRLVMPMRESVEAEALVRAIVDIAKSAGAEVVAEGVETFEHARALSAMGCTLLQGFVFAKPAPLSAIAPLLEARPWRQALRLPQGRPSPRHPARGGASVSQSNALPTRVRTAEQRAVLGDLQDMQS